MDNLKLETQLQMALSLPESVRQETMDLNVGYDDADERWTLLIRYVGDILAAERVRPCRSLCFLAGMR